MRTLRKVIIRGVEYPDITHAAQALNCGPETLLLELYRKGEDRWILDPEDHFSDDPNHLKEPPKETLIARTKEIHIPGGPPTRRPGESDYGLSRRRRIYFTKVQPFQTPDEKPPAKEPSGS